MTAVVYTEVVTLCSIYTTGLTPLKRVRILNHVITRHQLGTCRVKVQAV